MIGNRFPRYLLFGLAVGTAVAVIILSMFYGQYRWLANEITSSGAAEHEAFLRRNHEIGAQAQLSVIGDDLAARAENPAAVLTALNRALADNETLVGLRFVSRDLDMRQAGSIPAWRTYNNNKQNKGLQAAGRPRGGARRCLTI